MCRQVHGFIYLWQGILDELLLFAWIQLCSLIVGRRAYHSGIEQFAADYSDNRFIFTRLEGCRVEVSAPVLFSFLFLVVSRCNAHASRRAGSKDER